MMTPPMSMQPIQHKNISQFQTGLRQAMRGFWAGALTRPRFSNAMFTTIEGAYIRAWTDGARQCGIRFEDLSQDEIRTLDDMIDHDTNYIFGLADFIEANQRGVGLLRDVFARVPLWVNRYNAVRNRARTMACADGALIWVLGVRERHCSSCSTLAAQVRRGSFWEANVQPQSQELACSGFRCGCQLVPTDAPITRGRLPNWR